MITDTADKVSGGWVSTHPIATLFGLFFIALVLGLYLEHQFTVNQFKSSQTAACNDRIRNTKIANDRTIALRDMFTVYNRSRIIQAERFKGLSPADRRILLAPVVRWNTVDAAKIQLTHVHSC